MQDSREFLKMTPVHWPIVIEKVEELHVIALPIEVGLLATVGLATPCPCEQRNASVLGNESSLLNCN